MRKLCVASIMLLTACQSQTQSYPLMGKTYVSEMKQGFEGCLWKAHKIKTKQPLGGVLKFSTINCSSDNRNAKNTHKQKFSITNKNELVVSSSPQDSTQPHQAKYSPPIITLHKVNTPDIATFMTKFLKNPRDKDCVIEDNGFGRWQSGFRKDTLIQRGYKFVSEQEYEALSSKQRMGQLIELENLEFFPMEIALHSYPQSPLCGRLYRDQLVPNVFRGKEHIIFEYDRPLIESAAFIDPGSIEYIE